MTDRPTSDPKTEELLRLHDGSIDAGLHLLEVARPPGRTYSAEEIAYVCGCSRSNIWLIERRALGKLRRQFERRGVS